uniref:Uncharacterized protein n=1 Tax=Acanthochromis polyacanthus TaxID=80966 RepID=A0A3Q1GE25_9TELE
LGEHTLTIMVVIFIDRQRFYCLHSSICYAHKQLDSKSKSDIHSVETAVKRMPPFLMKHVGRGLKCPDTLVLSAPSISSEFPP